MSRVVDEFEEFISRAIVLDLEKDVLLEIRDLLAEQHTRSLTNLPTLEL